MSEKFHKLNSEKQNIYWKGATGIEDTAGREKKRDFTNKVMTSGSFFDNYIFFYVFMIKLPVFFTTFRGFKSRIVIFLFYLQMELYTLRKKFGLFLIL